MKNSAHNLLILAAASKMRVFGAFLLLLLLCTASCGQPAATVEKKVFEQDRDKDGIVDLRVETIRRGKEKVFIRKASRLPNGAWSVSHFYKVRGETVCMEIDEDGDGLFETLIVFDPPNKDFEIFLRQKDGSIVLASDDIKESFRKTDQILDEFFNRLFSLSATNDAAIEKLVTETQERIHSASEPLRRLDSPAAGGPKPGQEPR